MILYVDVIHIQTQKLKRNTQHALVNQVKCSIGTTDANYQTVSFGTKLERQCETDFVTDETQQCVSWQLLSETDSSLRSGRLGPLHELLYCNAKFTNIFVQTQACGWKHTSNWKLRISVTVNLFAATRANGWRAVQLAKIQTKSVVTQAVSVKLLRTGSWAGI